MKVNDIFLSVNARDFVAQTHWWTTLMGRDPDRKPMPGCREWDLAPRVRFQVLDATDDDRVVISLRIADLSADIARLRQAGLDVPDPAVVEGFDTLRLTAFADPEGNRINLLEGELM